MKWSLFSTFYVIIIALMLTLISCDILNPNDFSIRIRNNYYVALSVKVGSIDFGKVPSGATTDYKSIDPGTYTLSGDVTGTLKLEGSGTHKWTVTIDTSGTLSSNED